MESVQSCRVVVAGFIGAGADISGEVGVGKKGKTRVCV